PGHGAAHDRGIAADPLRRALAHATGHTQTQRAQERDGAQLRHTGRLPEPGAVSLDSCYGRPVLLRALALLATLMIPLLLAVEAVAQSHAAMFWVGPLAAVGCTLPILLKTKDRAQVLVAAALAAMAAASTPGLSELLRITGDESGLPVHDLREGPLPSDASGYVAVRGYLRDAYVVDEYHPAAG